jgi:hypothetical protein
VKIYEYNGKRILEFNGELFIQLDAVDVAVATTDPLAMSTGKHRQPYVTNRRGRKPGTKNTERLEVNDVAHIKEMINAGYKAAEIAFKYGVSAQYVYMLKMQMKRNGELTIEDSAEADRPQ